MLSVLISRFCISKRLVVLVAFISALAVSGCGAASKNSNAPTTAGTSQSSFETVGAFEAMGAEQWQSALTPLFNRAKDAVQNETGTDLSHIKFAVVPNREIEHEVATETGRLTHSQFTNNRFADHFLDSVMAGQSGTYAALYSTDSEKVMVSDSLLSSYINSVGNDAQAIKHALNALLIHELVHAADDARFGIHRNRHLSFRASFAQSAVYEGHAQYLTRRICQNTGCLPGLNFLDSFMFGDKLSPNQLSQPVQAVSRNVLEYSYIEGERFITSLALRENGRALIETALKAPPQDPIQILDPTSFPNTERNKLNQKLLDASRNVQHTWNSSPWVQVETSPLKGVNLRSDPDRRLAAIDGFTRLIEGMVALQHYDQSELDATPIEVTLMSTENDQTAEMFAQSLTSNLMLNGGGHASEDLLWLDPSSPTPVLSIDTPLDDGESHMALVVSHEKFVVQLVGLNITKEQAIKYTESVLMNLSTEKGGA